MVHMGEFRLLADINLHTQINRVCPQVEWCFFLLFFVVFGVAGTAGLGLEGAPTRGDLGGSS